jgi:chromate transporter
MSDTLQPSRYHRLLETCGVFLKLGCISFGGPIAHLGYFRAEFVVKRKWVEDDVFADLVALCQFLPGPASSQMVFALGMRRAGFFGAMIASLCFTLPSAILMILFAYAVSSIGDLSRAYWLHGLKLAAVAVVAQAVWGMGKNLCPDRARIAIGIIVAVLLFVLPGALTQLGVIAAGGIAGWFIFRKQIAKSAERTEKGSRRGHVFAVGALALFFILLGVLPILAVSTRWKPLMEFDSFYRSGSLVFGGGHVVLPLLRAELVPNGWVSNERFLAGYGAAQAIPGPLFTFSAYLGAAISSGRLAWVNGLWCLLGIFLPAWLLIGGALPFWRTFREKVWAQAALRGANAAVVGVLLSALYRPVMTESIRGVWDIAASLGAFWALQFWKAPPWVVVLLMAGAGQWALR